jgi:hypothetical protein
MTVSTTGSTAQFLPNGVSTHFPFAFRFFQNTDIKVFWQDLLGNIELLTLNSDYTVQGAGTESGGVVDTIGPPLPNGVLIVSRIMTATQMTSFRNQGEFFAEIHEDAFDRLVMLVQQTIDSQGRGITVPEGDPLDLDLVLPPALARAGKLCAFDDQGQPIESNLTMQEIEEQPAGAAASAAAAHDSAEIAGAAAESASASAGSASGSADASAASAASVTGAAVPMFSVMWWPGLRSAIPAGYVPGDGQLLSRALYPAAWSAISASNVPLATDTVWNAALTERGKFSSGDGSTLFRVPDYNGKSSGSIGAAFLRGDGGLSSGITGVIQRDQIQNITGEAMAAAVIGLVGPDGAVSGAFKAGPTVAGNRPSATAAANSTSLAFDASGSARTGTDTRPINVTGCFIIKLFGAVTNQGSADAAALATALAVVAADLQSSRAGSFANNYLSIEDRKAANTAAGTATAATWTTRDLNSVRVNRITGASLASNQVTLPAGTYRFEARAPAIGVGAHQVRLRNITDSADVEIGSSSFSISTALNAQTDSVISGEFTITAAKAFEIQHNVAVTRATNGLGAAANLGTTEIYTQAKFWRLA